MKITQRMKNELKLFRYADTRNYRYELDMHYDGSVHLNRIQMDSIRRKKMQEIMNGSGGYLLVAVFFTSMR